MYIYIYLEKCDFEMCRHMGMTTVDKQNMQAMS